MGLRAVKWRPTLGLVLVLVIGTILALPLAGLLAFRISDNQLAHETEDGLVAQAAVLAAVAQHEIEAAMPADALLGPAVPAEAPPQPGPYRPIRPALDLAGTSPLPPRPDAQPAVQPADILFRTVGDRLMPVLLDTQRVTLAGFRLLDPRGVVVAGRDEVGLSLAHVDEVGAALQGRFAGVLRRRISKHPPPPLGSISRSTPVRVFVAMPIVVRQHVAGVIYASRTPDGLLSRLYALRQPLALATTAVIAAAALIGYVLHRTISVPVRDLIRLAGAIGTGDQAAIGASRRHGTFEFAALSQSFRAMATRLTERSDAVSTFAAHVSHEIKSPLTAIRGAAELLRDETDVDGATMPDVDRRRFLDNIVADTTRLDALLLRLRDIAQAEETPRAGTSTLKAVVDELRHAFPMLEIVTSGTLDTPLRLSAESLSIVLSHLADNAARHGATRLEIDGHRDGPIVTIILRDDGAGISPSNREHIFDPFFTTRRDSGGTGMGLAIVRALLRGHGGTITLADAAAGAAFALGLPVVPSSDERLGVRMSRPRGPWLKGVAGVIAAGLALRHFGPGWGLPFGVTKYGGSILWAAMVYGLVALVRPAASRSATTAVALVVAVLVECSRLLHTPNLDMFRESTVGALLVGRVFSPWNLVAYGAGILVVTVLDPSISGLSERRREVSRKVMT